MQQVSELLWASKGCGGSAGSFITLISCSEFFTPHATCKFVQLWQRLSQNSRLAITLEDPAAKWLHSGRN